MDRARLDYSRLRHLVANDRDVVFANAYIWQHDKSDSFSRALSHLSYNVRSVPYRDPAHELIAADLVDSSDNWDVAVLVTGEGEYGRFFRELRASGKWIEIHSVDLDCPIQRIKQDVDKHVTLPMEQLAGLGTDPGARGRASANQGGR